MRLEHPEGYPSAIEYDLRTGQTCVEANESVRLDFETADEAGTYVAALVYGCEMPVRQGWVWLLDQCELFAALDEERTAVVGVAPRSV